MKHKLDELARNSMCNKENKVDLYTKMLDIHKHIFDQLKYAEAKCGIITTINLAFFAILAKEACDLSQKNILSGNCFLLFCGFICLLSCLLCLYYLLKAFYPRLNNKESAKRSSENLEDKNIYFFEHIATLQADEFLKCVKEKFNPSDGQDDSALNDLSNQICVLSQIALEKHENCKKALNGLECFFVFFIIFILVACFSTPAQGAVIM